MADVSHCDACGAASSSSFTADSDAHGGWSKLLLLVMPMSPIGAVGSLRLVMCAPCTDRLLDAIRYDVLNAQRREKLRRGGE